MSETSTCEFDGDVFFSQSRNAVCLRNFDKPRTLAMTGSSSLAALILSLSFLDIPNLSELLHQLETLVQL